MAGPLLEISGLCKRFGTSEVLCGVDLTVDKGEVLGLIGPSGSGKSTLLRCVNNLCDYQAGGVWLNGELIGRQVRGSKLRTLSERDAATQRQAMGMVFQHFNLFDNLTVLRNVCLAPTVVLKRNRAETEARALALLDSVGLAGHAHKYPAQLSGGQQQRVAIARALAMDPALLLFDEPTSALDPEMVGEVLTVMRELAVAGMTMMVVTHEVRFVREIADRIAVMDAGRIIELGRPADVLDRPRHERTRKFLRVLTPAVPEAGPTMSPTGQGAGG